MSRGRWSGSCSITAKRCVSLPPGLMAGARQSVRERGKSDPIDALAVARAALREGIETLPGAQLAGPSSRSGCWSSIASAWSTPAPG